MPVYCVQCAVLPSFESRWFIDNNYPLKLEKKICFNIKNMQMLNIIILPLLQCCNLVINFWQLSFQLSQFWHLTCVCVLFCLPFQIRYKLLNYNENLINIGAKLKNLNPSSENTKMLPNNMQHQYWVTKKSVLRKLGGKEEDCIISSDAELDAKLELFKSINESCLQLQRIIDLYQERLCYLAQEENALGR